MDFRFSPQEEAFRQEVDDFIKKELPSNWAEESLYWPGGYGTIPDFEGLSPAGERFRLRLAEKGWLAISLPKEYGGSGRSHIEQAIFHERLSYQRAPGPGVATLISAPTILQFGSDEAKREWLPGIARGDIRFWLAYSEPNAGSDMAAIQTRAVEDGAPAVVLHDQADPHLPREREARGEVVAGLVLDRELEVQRAGQLRADETVRLVTLHPSAIFSEISEISAI